MNVIFNQNIIYNYISLNKFVYKLINSENFVWNWQLIYIFSVVIFPLLAS